MENVNVSLICKIGWFLMFWLDLWWVKVLKAKYFLILTSWNVIRKLVALSNGLVFWVFGQFCPKESVIEWRIINIWDDPWIPTSLNFHPIPKDEGVAFHEATVSSLLLQGVGWSCERLANLFDQKVVANIRAIFQVDPMLEDDLIWLDKKKGKLSTKSEFKYLETEVPTSSSCWKFLWSSYIHERVKLFMWRCDNHCLPLFNNLISHGIWINLPSCPFSCNVVVDECHLFLIMIH